MDLLSMLMNARIRDMDGDEIGEVLGVHIAMGKLYITVDMELDDGDEDPDDGEKEDIPEDDASNIVEKIHAIAGGKK
jgi:hypothetical protein